MLDHETIKSLAWHIIWPLGMVAVFAWLNKSRLKRGKEDASVMRVPVGIVILGLVGIALFTGLAVMMYLNPGVDAHKIPCAVDTETMWVLLGFSSIGWCLVINYFIERHSIGKDTLTYRTVMKSGVVYYRDIVRIRYSPMMRWFRIESSDARVIHIQIALTGLPAFARALLDKSPPESMDEATQKILTATAAGNPPSLWG